MKKDKAFEQAFLGYYVSELRRIGISTFAQLRAECVTKEKTYKRLSLPNLQLSQQINVNWVVARQLFFKKLIPEIEVTKQLTLSCYYTIIKKRARRALIFNKIRTIGDLSAACIEGGSFKVMDGKKIGPRVNYEAALVMKHLNFLSEKEFLKVPLPSWKARLLTDREVGKDGIRKLHKMEWSDTAKDIIIRAVTLKFPCNKYGGARMWHTITLGELVKTFVRIDSAGNAVFYTKGHTSSRWYNTTWFTKKLDEAFPEIEKKLFEWNFLSRIVPELEDKEVVEYEKF